MRRTTSTGRTTRLAVATLIAVGAALAPGLRGAWAQEAKAHRKRSTKTITTTTTTTTSEAALQQQKIDALSKQLEAMQKQQADLVSQIKDMKTQIAVAAPVAPANAPSPAAAPSPGTIGEHVATVESDLAATRSDLQKNLGVSVHGLVDAGYERNFNQPVNNVNYVRSFDEPGFQLTQGNLHIEKDGTVGFVTDLNVGQVANTISGATHYSNAFPVGGQWFDATQYYLTYTVPIGSGLALQAGRFVTLLGEETINTYNNQNYNESKSFIFSFGIPFTHTGIRATYTFNEYAALTTGLNNGWDDPAANNNGGPTWEGELALNNKDKTLALLLNGIVGSQALHKSNQTRAAIDPVLTWKPSFLPNTTLVSEYLYASQDGPAVNGHSASWTAFAQYFIYDLNEWEFATRGEFYQDKDGLTTGPDFNGVTAAKTIWELTQTVSYKVPSVAGLLVRAEYRHDNANTNSFSNNNFVSPATGQHLWHGQDTLLGALIYAF